MFECCVEILKLEVVLLPGHFSWLPSGLTLLLAGAIGLALARSANHILFSVGWRPLELLPRRCILPVERIGLHQFLFYLLFAKALRVWEGLQLRRRLAVVVRLGLAAQHHHLLRFFLLWGTST